MISDLVVNVSILMSFTFIWHQLFRKNRLTFQSPLIIKILDGIIAGLLGIVLMFYSIQVNDTTFLDLRHIPVVLVAYFGGPVPAILGGVVVSTGRFLFDVNLSSIVSFFMMIAIAIGASIIVYFIKTTRWKKWTLLLVYSQFLFSLALYIVSENFALVLDFAIFHIISTFVGGFLTFYFVLYIRRNTERYYQYKESSQRDSLTGLFNVRSFDHYYNEMLKKAIENNGACAMCLVDADHFKQINDNYGHPAGDEVLKQLAKILTVSTREMDIVSRNGGEEFSILLPNCSREQASEIAERIRKTVEDTPFVLPNNHTIRLTVSVGVATFENGNESPDLLFEKADDALYKAKHAGRNLVCSLEATTNIT